MKTFFLIATFVLTFSNVPSSDAQNSQIQNYEGMVILPSTYGDLICLGNWNSDLKRCDGPAVSSGALAAISAAKSVDKLEQIRLLLDTMNSGLSAHTQALLDIKKTIDLQNHPAKESIKQAITTRFDAIPAEILTDDSVRKEIERLKEDILLEVDGKSLKPPSSSGK
ncbi:MAG TPA: hypothetical protein VI382_04300 [Candidatus Manganitrophaceae bacterium]|nr:hypothetical protein [Candidatus Manganitrophaceae bacterium]